MHNADRGEQLLQGGLICSQAVLSVHCEDFGLPPAPALRLASGLGGGMCLGSEVCGAAAGAVLVLSLAVGPADARPGTAKARTFGLVRQFLTRFAAANGALRCRDILGGLDITDPVQAASIRECPELAARCTGCVRSALDILDELLPQREAATVP